MTKRYVSIVSASQVQKEAEERLGIKFELSLVRSVMSGEMGMRYRKITRISWMQNSMTNLVLRQQWALKFLEVMKQKRIVINVDESWLAETDFRRMKWQAPNTTNSIPTKQVAPRISMIFALDSEGLVYASFTQVNTDSKIMTLYLTELVKTLDKKDVNWRKNHFLLVDGAKYHQSMATFSILMKMRIPVMITAPHSYNVAPIELLFGAIKSKDLNQEQLPTGKANFKNIV
jgi:hypothetical protein